jgi:HSP20 family protein
MRTLTMYRPKAIHHTMNDFDRCFESFFGGSPFMPAAGVFNRLPAADIRETEKSYVLDMELPGYDTRDIDISVDGNDLFVASKQEPSTPVRQDRGSPLLETKESSSQPEEEKKDTRADPETWLLRERRISPFNRCFKLPENVNPEEVTAEFKNGILSIEIQKRPETQKKTITINAR